MLYILVAAALAADPATLSSEYSSLPPVGPMPSAAPGECPAAYRVSTGQEAPCTGILVSPTQYDYLRDNRKALNSYMSYSDSANESISLLSSQVEVYSDVAAMSEAVQAQTVAIEAQTLVIQEGQKSRWKAIAIGTGVGIAVGGALGVSVGLYAGAQVL